MSAKELAEFLSPQVIRGLGCVCRGSALLNFPLLGRCAFYGPAYRAARHPDASVSFARHACLYDTLYYLIVASVVIVICLLMRSRQIRAHHQDAAIFGGSETQPLGYPSRPAH
jgi:hypothetical protein